MPERGNAAERHPRPDKPKAPRPRSGGILRSPDRWNFGVQEMKLQKANGLTADNSQPANLLSKTKPNCTTKSIAIASFVSAYLIVFSFENYGIWAALPPICGLMTIVFWGTS